MSSEADILQARHLNKRTKLGPPDVYPQVKDQKEDKLNDLSLKKGFSNPPVTSNECGSARERIKAKGLSTLHQNILQSSKELAQMKHNNNTVNDNGTRKIQTIQRDQFWSVNPRSNRQTIKKFFGDLSSSSKTLASLVKSRIPSFQKKEEILDHMAEYQVPVMRAIWFMKITAVYVSSISKKRNTCVALEWTKCISEYLKDNLSKFAEHNVDYGKISTVNTGNKAVQEANAAKNRWNYTLRLCHCMYQDGLLDRQEFLLYIIKWVHELKITEKEDILKHLVQVMLTYMDDVIENFVLARSAAYMCVHKLNSLSEIHSVRSTFDWDSAVKDCHVPARSNCPYHDALLLVFSTILQRVTLMCPTALVYQRSWQSPLGSSESSVTVEKESPLDHLPCYPASLPCAKSLSLSHVEQLRSEIQDSTEDVRARSVIAEERWVMGEDTNQAPSVIPMLTTLDEHNFYTAQQDKQYTVVQGLYKKVFGPVTKPHHDQLKDDAPIVSGLCEWAVTHRRTGSHRWLVVAELLKKRQTALLDGGPGKKGKKEEYIFQDILFKYLNETAPTWTVNEEDRIQFKNMIILFGELVRSMFSYEKYLKKLISRGDLPMRLSKTNLGNQQDFTLLCKELHTLPRHIQYVLSLPLTDNHKEELKQRAHLLFGSTGVQAPLPIEFTNTFNTLKTALLNLGGMNTTPYTTLQQLSSTIERFKILPSVYKCMITQRLMDPILPAVPPAGTTPKLGSSPIILPTVSQVELMYFLMELSGDVRSMMTLSMDMMNRFAGLKKFVSVPLDIYLCITAVLKKYQTCLLISERDTEFVFNALSRLTEKDSPVSAAEKCILVYSQELHKASPKLSNNREEPNSPKYSSSKKQRLKAIPSNISPHSETFKEAVDNPSHVNIVQISDKIGKDETSGQSFVSTVIIEVCSGYDKHKIPDLVKLCAELTTQHTYLEAIWISAINSPHQCGELPEGPDWWRMLSLFVIQLLRYQCFSLWWLIYYVILPYLYKYSEYKWPTNCHVAYLMLALFTEIEYPATEHVDDSIIVHSAFRHLDADRRALKPLRFATMLKLLIRNSTVDQEIPPSHKHLKPMSVLKKICSQTWVPELCLSTPEKLVSINYLADKEITPHNAQLLLHLICNPQSTDIPSTDPTELIGNIIKSMDMWTMRSAHLKVRLIRVRSKENNEGEEEEAATLKLITDAVVSTLGHLLTEIARGSCKNSTLWLLPTFINKLHDQVKEHLIKWLGEWLGEGSWWENNFTYCENTSWQQPLLVLMTGCLSNKIHVILPYLMSQLKRFVDEVKDIENLDEKQVEQVNVALHFRLSLVGAHFHHIVSNSSLRLDWGILLLRLVRHPAVDSTRLGEGILFFSILDMLASIMEPLETACYNSEDVNARTMFFKRICNEIHDIDNPANLQVRQLLKIPLYKQEVTVVEHTSVNEEWSQRTTPQFEQLYPELKPEGYVPVSKHSVSPWELVEGAKGGCNVVPWQEIGGVRYDRQPDKMEERLSVSLRGHTHDMPPLEHEQVSIPNAPKPKIEPQGAPPQQFINFQARPPLMMPGQPRMMRPMQAAHFSGIMGAPAPNVTITQQGPVPNFNPHEQVPGQFQFDQGNKPHFTPPVTGQQQQQMFDNNSSGFIDTGGMARSQFAGPPPGQRMMRPQFAMTEQQKRQLMESQQQKVRLQGHPGMVFQPAQQPPQSGSAQAPPPYLQQHLGNTGIANPNMTGTVLDSGGLMNTGMLNQPPPHQFLHRPMMGQRPPMSLPVSMTPISSGNIGPPASDTGYSQTSFFDQQFT